MSVIHYFLFPPKSWRQSSFRKIKTLLSIFKLHIYPQTFNPTQIHLAEAHDGCFTTLSHVTYFLFKDLTYILAIVFHSVNVSLRFLFFFNIVEVIPQKIVCRYSLYPNKYHSHQLKAEYYKWTHLKDV